MEFEALASIPPRIRKRIVSDEASGCWLWTGAKTKGYGCTRDRYNKLHYVHRYVYQRLVGPIAAGLVTDHLCRTPACVRPDHLEMVPQRINILRGNSLPSRRAQQTHCIRGHLLPQPEIKRGRRMRICMECVRIRNKWHSRRTEEQKARRREAYRRWTVGEGKRP